MTPNKPNTLQQRFGFQDPELTTPAHDAIMIWLDENCQAIIQSIYPAWEESEIEINRSIATRMAQSRLSSLDQEIKKQSAIRDDAERRISKFLDRQKDEYTFEVRRDFESSTTALVKYQASVSVLDKWSSLGDPPEYSAPRVARKIWEPPIMNGSYIIGFIDMKVTALFKTLSPTMGNDIPYWAVISESRDLYFEVKPKVPSLGEVIRQVRMYGPHAKGDFFIVSPDTRFRKQIESQGIGFIEVPSL